MRPPRRPAGRKARLRRLAREASSARWARPQLLIPLAGLVAGVASAPLRPTEQTALLALVGGALVAVTEVSARAAEQRRFGPGGAPRAARTGRRWDLAASAATGIAGGLVSWLLVTAGTATPLGGWPLLVAGGVAAIAATLVAAVATGARGTPGRRR